MNIFLIAAISLDGFIAQHKDQVSTEWTSPEDKQFFIKKTKESGVMIMGRTTYNTIGRPLPGRLSIVYTKILPSLVKEGLANGRGGVENDPTHPNLRYTNLEPKKLIQELEKEGYTQIAICGGSSIYTLFLQAGLVDTLYLTIEPFLMGTGISLLNQPVLKHFKQVRCEKVNDQGTMITEYKSEV